MRKAPEGYRVFGEILYKFHFRGTKREVEKETKRMNELGYRMRRTKCKGGWNLWKGFFYKSD